MRAVTCLIETLDTVPCDVWASVNALTQVSSRTLDNGGGFFTSNLIVRQESRLVLLLELL